MFKLKLKLKFSRGLVILNIVADAKFSIGNLSSESIGVVREAVSWC
jgi:hypothetical protein